MSNDLPSNGNGSTESQSQSLSADQGETQAEATTAPEPPPVEDLDEAAQARLLKAIYQGPEEDPDDYGPKTPIEAVEDATAKNAYAAETICAALCWLESSPAEAIDLSKALIHVALAHQALSRTLARLRKEGK